MGRKPKGKALTLRPIRLDDDVWAECQRLGKKHGTINEGLRSSLLISSAAAYLMAETGDPWKVVESVMKPRPFKGPLLKPKERK